MASKCVRHSSARFHQVFNVVVYPCAMNALSSSHFAVLIDGENFPASAFDALQLELKKFGRAAIFRVFGDFSNKAHANWLDVCRAHGLEAVLHMPVKAGKNGTDMVMAISAMDIMVSGHCGSVVLVSDDGDFLPLVRRLRAGGMNVHGLGNKAENVQQFGSHSSWTQLSSETIARKKETHNPVTNVKSASLSKSAPKQKQAMTQNDGMATKFGEVVHTRLANGSLTLSALGLWLRQQHSDLIPLLGPGKLKKLLNKDERFKVGGASVSLAT